MNLEKWMAWALLSFAMILVAFNLVGSMWMIVMGKRQDVAILKSMGADNKMVRNIFLLQGFLLTVLGLLIGITMALLLYSAQKLFGIVSVPAGFVIDAYPVELIFGDILLAVVTVIVIGALASVPAAMRAARVKAIIRND